MSNRHQRRADLKRLRKETRGSVVSYLVEPDDPRIAREPLLASTVLFWRASVAIRKPVCFGCEASFADGATVGAFLMATADEIAPRAASVSGLCVTCWTSKSMDQIEHASMKVLQKLR